MNVHKDARYAVEITLLSREGNNFHKSIRYECADIVIPHTTAHFSAAADATIPTEDDWAATFVLEINSK